MCTPLESIVLDLRIGLINSWRHSSGTGRKEMFYLTTHSTHFIYGYVASDIWQSTTQIGRKESRCRHIGYSFRLTARVILYALFHKQDNTYHGLCYTSGGALAGSRNSFVKTSQILVDNNPVINYCTETDVKSCIHFRPFNLHNFRLNKEMSE